MLILKKNVFTKLSNNCYIVQNTLEETKLKNIDEHQSYLLLKMKYEITIQT